MGRLDTLEEQVREVLRKDPKARDDDRVLTLDVWVNVYKINPWAPICEVMRNKDLPSQESLGRVRRQIQRYDESLRGTKHKENIRLNAQADYMDYNESSITDR